MNLIAKTLEKIYLICLGHYMYVFAPKTSLEFIKHLNDNSSNVISGNIEENLKRMKTPYDVNQPTENLYDHIEEGMDSYESVKIQFTPKKIIYMVYNLVFNVGIFQDECRIWRKLLDTEQTWVKFQDISTEPALDI